MADKMIDEILAAEAAMKLAEARLAEAKLISANVYAELKAVEAKLAHAKLEEAKADVVLTAAIVKQRQLATKAVTPDTIFSGAQLTTILERSVLDLQTLLTQMRLTQEAIKDGEPHSGFGKPANLGTGEPGKGTKP